ncbi:patatin-like phospholipase family protein [Siccirubricoccus sp. KC 17139]|uniref:Patatin-like phospholipase family protein n=1 Tax=Siccirubricoccus soli TaxID=2899147 RepID=A0ABT1D5K5_9PROT|nr:patatin-like phospholipase family protein [Siccirubricoccus soli]MCO6417207.1 patatin-like phospholipase family protein [Siccirubricoccus soli]MCP2683342.1 patatin-like phospholipase family protein [Siccirubricoccus soli]
MLDETGSRRGSPEAACAAAWQRARAQYDEVVLLLQGGGALGSYQGGVYEVLAETPFLPDWVAGISIGAVNAALIAGNRPEDRVARIREFWRRVTSRVHFPWLPPLEAARNLANLTAAATALLAGQPGFFRPRRAPPYFLPASTPTAVSFYDTEPLRQTLLELVDFDLLNHGPVRLSVGAVNIRTGNTIYFDNRERRIGPEHIMASGALPPGFPPVMIEGELYWDGGLVSNTPLQYVLDVGPPATSLMFQLDLFSSRGVMPRTLPEADERAKDIRYSSRTRLVTDIYRRMQAMRCDMNKLLAMLPEAARHSEEARRIAGQLTPARVNLIQLVYRRAQYDRDFKDYEFSANTMLDHWQAGRDDLTRTLRQTEWLEPPDTATGLVTHDVHFDAPG